MPMIRLLFVEDDAMNRRVVGDMMRIAGIDLTEAGSGEEGLALIEAHDYDALLLDLRMPGMDGTEVISAVRARTDTKAHLPIIILTADATPGLREDCIARGAQVVLFKPVAMEDLYMSIARAASGETLFG